MRIMVKVAGKVKHKRIIALLLSLGMIFLSGCWDMVEIEKRALIGAMVIDSLDKEENKEGNSKASPFCEDRPNNIKIVFGINNPTKLQEGGKGAAITKTVEAVNVPDAMEKLGNITSRMPFYGQVRLLLFTDKLVKNEKIFRETLDEFERKAIINQQMKIIVLEGELEDIFKVEPKLENVQSLYVTGIMDNSKVLSNTISLNLGELNTKLRSNDGSAAIPVLNIKEEKENSYEINKLALIKDYKLLTILDTKYIKSYKIIRGELDNGRKLITYKGINVPFFIFSAQRRIWLEEGEGGLKFRVKVELEGDIEQFVFDKELFDPKIIADVKKVTEEFITRELEATTVYFQEEIGHDYLGFNEYTDKYHYKIYKKYENNWDEVFKNAKIDYDVTVNVRRIGTSKK